jgi:hypothetical protein
MYMREQSKLLYKQDSKKREAKIYLSSGDLDNAKSSFECGSANHFNELRVIRTT